MNIKRLFTVFTAFWATFVIANADLVNGIFYRCYENGSYMDNEAWVCDADEDLSGDIVIPATVEKDGIVYTVVRIDENALQHRKITSIILPDGVISISEDAFSGCDKLVKVVTGKNLRHIGEDAFGGCTSLKDFTCTAETPPTCTDGEYTFSESPMREATLHVPEDLKEIYHNTVPWSLFGTIDTELPGSVATVDAQLSADGKTYNVQGVQVDDTYSGIVIKNKKKLLVK